VLEHWGPFAGSYFRGRVLSEASAVKNPWSS